MMFSAVASGNDGLHDALTFVTDFADQAVALPLLVVVAAVLMAQRRWRLVVAWLLAVCGVLGTILVLKIAFFACGWLLTLPGDPEFALTSPSGHTASAAVEYGGLLALLATRPRSTTRRARASAALAGLAVAGVVGFTRVELGAHTLAEVVVAAAVGLVGAVAFVTLAGPSITERSAIPAWVAGLLVVALFHGQHLPAEVLIQNNAAALLRHYAPVCQPQPSARHDPPGPVTTVLALPRPPPASDYPHRSYASPLSRGL